MNKNRISGNYASATAVATAEMDFDMLKRNDVGTYLIVYLSIEMVTSCFLPVVVNHVYESCVGSFLCCMMLRQEKQQK